MTMHSSNTLYPFLDAQPSPIRECNFPDGDVSLLVEQTSFRVHRDKLVRHSHVFDDMFVVAQLDEEDCPTDSSVSIRMPDTAEEWGLVFSVLYPPRERSSRPSITPLRDIAVALRMAEKYDVSEVHAWAVAHLSRRYPPSLSYLSPTDMFVETASFALSLARMYNLGSIVPSACFALATGPATWHLAPDELRRLLAQWLEIDDVERVVAGQNVLLERTRGVRCEIETTPSRVLAPYCSIPGPSGHVPGSTYSRASKSCQHTLAERIRQAFGCEAGRIRSSAQVRKTSRHLLDALQFLEEIDELDIVVWPSLVCHVCSLVHSRWVSQTKTRVVRDILKAFEN